ncbi:hypothetical protein FQN53_005670 [Emmonsiellopsis sp. PD_33]|nr:hypothetical protein FQN53_005670 [Emmonsiellopsis sp. PD_33]
MIRSLGIHENEVAKWVGFTSAIFSLCQCLTAVPWGAASDRVGRKPIILIGLFINMTFSLVFGFSSSLAMAILARAVIGLGNGNVGILRTVVAELVPQKELQPRAFSIMPLVWTIGSIFGPALGGALANPAKKHQEMFGNSEFFKKYPYALPNMAVAVFFIISISTGFLFLQETLESKRGHRDYGLMLGSMLKKPFVRRKMHKTPRGFVIEDGDETTPLLDGDESRETDTEQNTNTTKITQKSSSPSLPWSRILTLQSNLVLLSYATMSLHTLAFDSLFPVFLNHPIQTFEANPDVKLPFKFSGGFGMDPQQIGILYTIQGIIGMVLQFLIFPYVCQRYGVRNCLRATAVVYPLLFFLTPFTVLFPTNASRQFAAFALMCGKLSCGVFSFPCNMILLTNSAASMQILGTLNGVATSVSAIGKAIGPAGIGAAFSMGVKKGYMILPWWLLSGVAALSSVPVFLVEDQDHFGQRGDDEEEEEEEDEEDGGQIGDGNRNDRGGDDEARTNAVPGVHGHRNDCNGTMSSVSGVTKGGFDAIEESSESSREGYWTIDDPPPPSRS